MCHGSWVCFACRKVIRRPTWRHVTWLRPWLIGSTEVGRVPCPTCGELCQFLGPTIEVPPRRDLKGWERLRNRVERLGADGAEAQEKRRVRETHKIERTVADLQSRPANKQRAKLIKKLKSAHAQSGRAPAKNWVRGRSK